MKPSLVTAKLNPTLFDKLTLGGSVKVLLNDGRSELEDVNARFQERGPVDLDRYTEAALRASVRLELSCLLNTVRLGATQDLSGSPEVKTSVLNYGLPDLTGKVMTPQAVQDRAREMEEAIRIFEPRLDPDKLCIEALSGVGMDNAISFVIRGDITAAVKALPVKFFATVEVETGEAVVQE